MRSPARFWLTLTQLALLAGCSGRLPLDVNGSAPDHEKLPVELAGSGGRMGGGAGVAGGSSRPTPSRPDAGPTPGKMPAVCGNGQIEAPEEFCDRTNLNGADCKSLGYSAGGVLLCNPATCTYDTLNCRTTIFDAGAGRPSPGEADGGSEDAG